MADRIMLLAEPGQDLLALARWTLGFARRMKTRVVAVGLIDPDDLPAGDEREDALSVAEEQTWQRLYEIEDQAFRLNAKVSLIVEQGRPLDRLLELAESYDARLLVLSTGTRLDTGEVLARAPIPVLFARGTKEHP